MIAPWNVLIGDLCPLATADGKLMDTKFETACPAGEYCPQWDRIGLFYFFACMLNVAGMTVFIVLTCTEVGSQVYKAKDESLVPTSSGRRRASNGRERRLLHKEQQDQADRERLSSMLAVSTGVDAKVPAGKQIQSSGGSGFTVVEANEPSVYDSSDDASVSSEGVWKRTLACGLTMMLALCENLLVCGQYSNMISQGQIASLGTVMMYFFYVGQCLGAATLMSKTVQKYLDTQKVLLVLALIRLPGVPLIYIHNSQMHDASPKHRADRSAGVFGDDWEVLLFYFVHMWLGGVVFCQCFTVATNLFDDPAEKTVGATVMNVLYYCGVIMSSVFLLLV